MPERRRTRWLDSLPWGLVGAVALIVIGEQLVVRNVPDLVLPELREWAWCGEAARSIAPRCDVLCFGSSMTNMALMSDLIEQHTGYRTYNLALCWGPTPAHEALLRRALRAGARPKAILVEFHPHSLSVEPSRGSRFWPMLLSFGECLGLSWTRAIRSCWDGSRPPGRCRVSVTASVFEMWS